MLAVLMLVGGSLGDCLGRRRVYLGRRAVLCSRFHLVRAGSEHHPTHRRARSAGCGRVSAGAGKSGAHQRQFRKKERRGQAIGTWSRLTAIASGIGPVLGGWLVEGFSWRGMFCINLPLAATVLLSAWRRVPESCNEQTKGRVDWLGATWATLGLGGLVFGLIKSNARLD